MHGPGTTASKISSKQITRRDRSRSVLAGLLGNIGTRVARCTSTSHCKYLCPSLAHVFQELHSDRRTGPTRTSSVWLFRAGRENRSPCHIIIMTSIPGYQPAETLWPRGADSLLRQRLTISSGSDSGTAKTSLPKRSTGNMILTFQEARDLSEIDSCRSDSLGGCLQTRNEFLCSDIALAPDG